VGAGNKRKLQRGEKNWLDYDPEVEQKKQKEEDGKNP